MQYTIVAATNIDDVIDELIVTNLKWHYDHFGEEQRIPFVSHNTEEEAKYVKQMRKALKRVINFYSVQPLEDNNGNV